MELKLAEHTQQMGSQKQNYSQKSGTKTEQYAIEDYAVTDITVAMGELTQQQEYEHNSRIISAAFVNATEVFPYFSEQKINQKIHRRMSTIFRNWALKRQLELD